MKRNDEDSSPNIKLSIYEFADADSCIHSNKLSASAKWVEAER